MKSSLFELIEEFSFWTRVRSSILNTIRSALHYKHSPIHKYPYHALFRRCDLFFFFFAFHFLGKKFVPPTFWRRATPLVYKEWVSFFFAREPLRDLFVPLYDSFPMNPEKKRHRSPIQLEGSLYICVQL